MATLVLYYSATGNTRRLAHALAALLHADCAEIACAAYKRGVWGPFRQALDVLLGRNPPIEIPAIEAGRWDLVVLGCPVWGARPAPPMRSYLAQFGGRHTRLGLFVSCKGTSPKYPPERAMAEMAALCAVPPERTRIFTEAQLGAADAAGQLAEFAGALRA